MRGPVLAQMTGAEHTAKRKIVIRGFTGPALQDQIRAVHANAAELLAPFLPRGRVDLVNDFGRPLAVQVALDVLGLDKNDWQQVADWHSGIAECIEVLLRGYPGLQAGEETTLLRSRTGTAESPSGRFGVHRPPADTLGSHGN
ncbi:hypothetical protein F7R91_41470 [Streptomyces luteolifulvus]|uniref:Cytochrome P450 n=1 Tax=Streptomyces luteolifulvus TaxID=2615112 RepID=A0A643JRK6_9ACTN|nr:hypothetical protein [Streptomyces luteolifulvus]KAB1138970.1 hypothetical protein F7R91_41470 [Streptomyces luteolifulvus]